jgi:hypothetical protein
MTTEKLEGKHWIAIDFAGPFEETEEGYKHVLVAIDYKDSWPEIVPTKEQSASEVKRALEDVVEPSSGVPDVVLSDRGSHFLGEGVQEYYKARGIDKRQTAAGNPQADGKAEALVKKVKDRMLKMAKEEGKSWAKGIPKVLVALRSSPTEPFGISPFEARVKRKMKLPTSFQLPQEEAEDATREEVEEMEKRMAELRDEKAQKMKKAYDKGRKEVTYTVGDRVWHENTEGKKTDPKRIGPFEVVEVLGPLNVRLAETQGGPAWGRRHDVVNIKHVEKFEVADNPSAIEYEVESVEDHKGRARNRKYKVVWKGGAVTWEPRRNLVDKIGGEEVVAKALEIYWRRHPKLKRD